jgi:hypothetical protein
MVIPYTETTTYRDRLTKLEADVVALETIIAEIAGIRLYGGTVKRKRTLEEKRRLDNAKSRLKTARKKLAAWKELKITPWDVVHLIQAADSRLWSPKQYELWHKELAPHEGRGEASLRDYYGLPPAKSTTEEVDLPENGVEAKNVQGRGQNGTLQLQTIQAGKAGRKAYSVWMGTSAESGIFKGLPEDVRIALFTGEVTRNVIYGHLPEDIRRSLLAAIRPSTVFAALKAIDCTTRNGSLHLPKGDFDAAWDIVCVTKCGPKYALKRGYLWDRLKATLSAAQHGADVAA